MCALFCRKLPRLRENKALRWVDGGSHTKQILKDYFSADNEVLFRTVIDVLLYSLGPLAVVAIATWQSSWFLCSASTLAHTLSLFLTHKHIFSPTLTHSLLLFLSLSSPSFSVMTHSSQVCTQHRLQMLFIEFWECSWEEKKKSSGAAFNSVGVLGMAGRCLCRGTHLVSFIRPREDPPRYYAQLYRTASAHKYWITFPFSLRMWKHWLALFAHNTSKQYELSLWIAGKCKCNSSVSHLIFTSVHGGGGLNVNS